jgi:hemolysin III
LVLSAVGGIALVVSAISHGDVWRILGCSVFATTLVSVYAASTLSHALTISPRKEQFEMLDQAAIYLLIAGTYTPFALAYLRSGWWWLLLGAMWVLALFGCVVKLMYQHRLRSAAVWTYVVLGWLPIVAVGAYVKLMPIGGLWWTLIGGLCYTIGTLFLMNDRKHPAFHAVWHLLVIAGSTCHFIAILLFVASLPDRGM